MIDSAIALSVGPARRASVNRYAPFERVGEEVRPAVRFAPAATLRAGAA